MKILLTGAAGFIGSAFARLALTRGNQVVVLDKLTYAGHLENLSDIQDPNFSFHQGSLSDEDLILKLLEVNKIDHVVNMAAESHMDNSIHLPKELLDTNIKGTNKLLNYS